MLLTHRPLNPPRPGHFGEQTYAATWEAMAETTGHGWDDYDTTAFEGMFSTFRGTPGQAEATLAASLLKWLGTNCGQAYLTTARQMASKMPAACRESAYRMAWAEENSRRLGVNYGIRTLENMLTPVESFGKEEITRLRGEDYEAAECVISWLTSRAGEQFVDRCQAAIKRNYKEDMLRKLETQGFGTSRLAAATRAELEALA